MKQKHISKYIISVFFFFVFFSGFTQEIGVRAQIKKDTVADVKKYGFRLGIDLWGFVRDKMYGQQGRRFLFTGDYRLKKNLYLYVAVGRERKTVVDDFYSFQTTGDFLKLGANFNVYQNWLSMDNEIYLGLRYGVAFFQHRLNHYQVFQRGIQIDKRKRPYFPTTTVHQPKFFKELNAHWLEFVVGVQTEFFANFYVGIEMGIASLLFHTPPENFANLYIPGFNTVFEGGTGAVFQYTMSYRIPFFKR